METVMTLLENIDILEDANSFILAVRDREVTNGQRWVLTLLSEDEARKVYEYLRRHFN